MKKRLRPRRGLCLVLAVLLALLGSCPGLAAELVPQGGQEPLPLSGVSFLSLADPGVGMVRRQVPILMYHHLYEEPDSPETEVNANALSVDQFEEQLAYLKENGYTAVSIQQLTRYVERGWALPRKPVCITFDDGYLSNYQLAFPLLKKYNMKATIFVIGSTVGDTEYYKDTQFSITPHFDYEQAQEMAESGLVSIQSHTYDMHQTPAYETGPVIRETVLKLPGETEEQYAQALEQDFLRSKAEIETATGQQVTALAYPKGACDSRSEEILEGLGVKVTFTVRAATATLVQGDTDSLRRLPRYWVKPSTTLETFRQWLGEK